MFDKYEHYCIDLMQSLIILPLEEQNYSEMHKSYEIFIKEWIKIENQISSPFYTLYILKGVMDSARYVRAAYTLKHSRVSAAKTFRHQIYNRINEVAKFCKIENLNYEKMLCSLLVFSKCLEGILYDIVSTRMAEKNKTYKKLPLQSIEQIYGAIEVNIPDNYIFNKNTSVFILNSIEENSDIIYNISEEQLKTINNINPITRGTFLYDMYKSQK